MYPERKRRWFQIHLSTAIVVMFAAAGLTALNCIPNCPLQLGPFYKWGYSEYYGCPYWFAYVRYTGAFTTDRKYNEYVNPEPLQWRVLPGLPIDLFANGALLVLIACVCEWRIRAVHTYILDSFYGFYLTFAVENWLYRWWFSSSAHKIHSVHAPVYKGV